MGMFLSLSGVIGKTQNQVRNSLTNYVNSVKGGLEVENLTTHDKNCCVIEESNANTTIFYLEWDKSSEFISRELSAPVFSFHIHDGDLWMYVLYVNGQVVDQFNPIPDYWADNLTDEEIASWKGDASIVTKHIPGLGTTKIDKYLTRWDLDAEENSKAYEDDEFENEDWQLLDFMKKCGLPYPLDDAGNAKGQTYKLWTDELQLTNSAEENSMHGTKTNEQVRPWWKFWS